MTYILASCNFSLFLFFINRLLRVRKTTRELLPFLGFASVFLCGSIAFIFVSWFDFYRWQYNEPLIQLFKLYSALSGGSYLSVFITCEFILKKTKYLISMYLATGAIIILFSNNMQDLNLVISITSAPVALIAPIMVYFIFIKTTSGFLRRRMYIACSGFILWIAGLFGRNDFFTELIGPYFYSLATICMIFGICFFGYGFAAFSTFTDLNWKKKLRELFVISNSGICLYAFSFDQNLQIEDSDLVAGGLSGIQLLLSEIIKTTDTVQLIDYQNVKIMVEQKPNAMFVLIIKEESTFLRYKLRLFAEEFETFFKDTLQRWSGQVELFEPTKALISRVFEVKEV